MEQINKQKIIIIASVLLGLAIIVILVTVLLKSSGTSANPAQLTYKTEAGETVTINNFKQNAQAVDGPAVTLQSEPKVATIMYNDNSKIFTVLVRADDAETFKQKRPLAEQQFLTDLGITKEQACKLRVEVSNDAPVSELPGVSDIQKLSFCP